MSFSLLLEKLDSWTRQGKKGLVVEALKKIDRNTLSLLQLIEIAKIANRNHIYSLALKYLFKIKTDFAEKSEIPPIEFTTTYAAALLGVGAIEEARSMLKSLKNHPQAVFSYALSFFSTWDYERALPLLERYLTLQKDDYMLLVGRINIIAAQIGLGDYNLGQQLLIELQKDLVDNSKASILLGNSFEIQSQIDIENRNYDKALQSLDSAKNIFQDQLTRYSLYVNKWQSVAELAKNPESKPHQQRLMRVKEQALDLKNWETLRDCDFQLARFTKNQSLMNYNLYGTPYFGYRSRVEKLYGFKVDFNLPYFYNSSNEQNLSSHPKEELSLNLVEPLQSFKNHSHCLNLNRHLLRDFYRPSRLGVVHAHLFPNEYFNPFTSPQRVRNTILRTNEIFDQMNTKAFITVKSGDVFFKTESESIIKVNQSLSPFKKDLDQLIEIRNAMAGRSFNSQNIQKLLSVSLRKAQLLIQLGLRKKIFKKVGTGKNTQYILSNHKTSLKKDFISLTSS